MMTCPTKIEILADQILQKLPGLSAWRYQFLLRLFVLWPAMLGRRNFVNLGRWIFLPRLRHYLEEGRIEIENNQIENKIRPLALGRKNYLFAGSHKAAQRAAMMYSFFATCKEHGINPRIWLRDVLLRIQDTRPSRIGELLPGRWKGNQEEGV